VRLVGIDSMNIDDTSRDATHGKARPVRSTLLGADILIVEHLRALARVRHSP
jgi:kynurenine formamidase